MPKPTRRRRKPEARRNDVHLNSRDQLAPTEAPELTILAALDHVLELATLTLGATHPELASDESLQRPLDPQAVLADQIVRHATRLTQAMTRYRIATLAAIRRRDASNDHSIAF